MDKLTKDQAIALAGSGFWETMSYRDRAMFQTFEDRLCMPFEVFHEAVTETLGRPVYVHEFGLNRAGLRRELLGEAPTPTLSDILSLIPPEKLVVLYARPRDMTGGD